MSSSVTEWSVDTKTSASETTSTALNNATLSGTLIVTGAVQLNGGINAPLTIGEDDTGHDVKFFGATSAQYMLWDESADELVLTGDSKLSFHDAAGGENIIATSDGHLEINAGTTLDITAPTVDINASTKVNIDGASQFNNTITVGVNDTGYDVKFFGATSGKYMEWDESSDQLDVTGSLDVTGNTSMIGTLTIGVDDAGHDVKFYGNTSGQYLLWDTSVDDLIASDNSMIRVGTSGDGRFYHDGTDTYLSNHNGNFNIVAATGIMNVATANSGIAVNIGHTTSETTVNDNLTVKGNLIAEQDKIIIGGSDDGTDKTITFRHNAIKTIMGIDDSNSAFVINTDFSFDGTLANNSLSIDASHNIITAGDLTLAGDLTVTGNDIKSSSATALTLSGADATVIGDLVVGGDKITFNSGGIIEQETAATVLSFGNENGYSFTALTGQALDIYLRSDANEDNADQWKFTVADNGQIDWFSYASGSYVTKQTLDTSGNLTVAGTLEGATSLTLDSTTLTTAELGVLDGVLAGTAAASKAVVLDGSKNIATIGTITCGTITQNSATLDATYSPIAGSSSIVTVGALDSGEITSGFTSIDVGAGAISTTGTVSSGASIIKAANDAAASILIQADNSDDAGDDWQITANTNQRLTFSNDIASAGSYVAHLTVTPHATVASSTVTVAGKLTIGGNAITTGSIAIDSSGKIALDSATGEFEMLGAGTTPKFADMYAGMMLGYTAIGIDATSDSYAVTTSFAVTDADHKVTFVAPPSGKVEIEVTAPIITISQRQLYLGLSDNATYAAISFPNATDVTNQHAIGDIEIYAFANSLTHKWVVEGLTAGTSYTWWLGAKAEQAGRITIHWGGNGDAEYAPFIMKATALPAAIHDGL